MQSWIPAALESYLRRRGTESLDLLVARFMERAPQFDGDAELAKAIGENMADLVAALEATYKLLGS